MKKIFLLTLLFIFLPKLTLAQSLSQELSGRILINVAGKGEAWYVNPADAKRYYLGRPIDAFNVMRKLGVGISELNFQKIAEAGMPVTGDLNFVKPLAGKIILQVEKHGEAWYINPIDLKKYYLGRPADAFNVMRRLGLGISLENLALIHKVGLAESIDQFSSYQRKTIVTPAGKFVTDIVTIDLANPKLSIITATADTYNCKTGCKAKALTSYIKETPVFAAINGTYFDTSAAKKNYYFFPVYNTEQGLLINEDQLKWWTTGPIMAFDQNNKFYYFKDSREFKSVSDFESKAGVKLQAAIGNKPRIIENYLNTLIDWEVDAKQLAVKTTRNAIAFNDNKLYLVVTYGTTVPDLGMVLEAMKVQYAINIDGGYSTAMFYNDELMAGPGRDIPNAILFATK